MKYNLNFIVDKNPIALVTQKIINSGIFDKIGEFIDRKLFNSAPENIKNFLFGMGILSLTYWSAQSIFNCYKKWNWVAKHFLYRLNVNQNYYKSQYGNCYVVITGCTDGIGLAFAQKFAKMGFDLILIARNPDKLDNVINELQNINSKCKEHKIVGDLSKIQDINKIVQQLNDFKGDIGIVINNAASATNGEFLEINPDSFGPDVNVGYHSMLKISRAMIPKLRNRQKRSALINLSSAFGHYNCQMAGIYPPLKFAVDIFTRTVHRENKDKIDVLSVKPFGVTTKMIKNSKGPFIITPQQCVISTLADLGKGEATFTGFKHKLLSKMFEEYSEKKKRKVLGNVMKWLASK